MFRCDSISLTARNRGPVWSESTAAVEMLVGRVWKRGAVVFGVALALGLFVATAGAARSTLFRFWTPSRNIYCGMNDNGSSQAGVFCEVLKPPAIASLSAYGRLFIRRGAREVGNPGEGDFNTHHVLAYGSSATAGRFRCSSAFAGVTCIVTKTGKGFFVSRQSVRRVG